MDRPVVAIALAESGSAVGVLTDSAAIVYDGDLVNETLRIAISTDRRLRLDSGGTLLALWSAEDASSRVRILDGGTGAPVADWALPSRINDLRFDPRGGRVVIALEDKSVQVWDARAGVALAVFRHEAAAVTACFLGDEGMVASGGWDGTVRIWPWAASMLIGAACLRLERNLTDAEWAQYLPGEAYRATCALPAAPTPRS
jgi:WD40 repeat protein